MLLLTLMQADVGKHMQYRGYFVIIVVSSWPLSAACGAVSYGSIGVDKISMAMTSAVDKPHGRNHNRRDGISTLTPIRRVSQKQRRYMPVDNMVNAVKDG